MLRSLVGSEMCIRDSNVSSVHERVTSLHSMLAREMDTTASNVFVISLGKSIRITPNTATPKSSEDTMATATQQSQVVDYQFAVRVRLPPSNSHAMRAAMSSFYTQNGTSNDSAATTAVSYTHLTLPTKRIV
eukprot:TRINITY_DN52082_c0_g1_i1.p1 TRINITY_DN52082_c0_g1~~TRINITY_DN52082_c0_g1_i1.p1  ORF type:complete len:132 (+),score=36.84 TRINITY_DN52082_c0_g1_i1:112-507(+)